jgi:hypothetical protein
MSVTLYEIGGSNENAAISLEMSGIVLPDGDVLDETLIAKVDVGDVARYARASLGGKVDKRKIADFARDLLLSILHYEDHAAEFVRDMAAPRYQRHRWFTGCSLVSAMPVRTPPNSQYSHDGDSGQ